MFTLLDEQKARKFWEEELRQEGRAEGELSTLSALVRKHLISARNAAEQVNMTEQEFCQKTGLSVQ